MCDYNSYIVLALGGLSVLFNFLSFIFHRKGNFKLLTIEQVLAKLMESSNNVTPTAEPDTDTDPYHTTVTVPTPQSIDGYVKPIKDAKKFFAV
jgi:hypothetical protein